MQTGDELAHDRRLFDPQHGFAEQAADQDQQQQLSDEQKLGRAFMGIARRDGPRRCWPPRRRLTGPRRGERESWPCEPPLSDTPRVLRQKALALEARRASGLRCA